MVETRLYDDCVTGVLELSRTVGGEYAAPAGDDVDYTRSPVVEGDIIEAGPIQPKCCTPLGVPTTTSARCCAMTLAQSMPYHRRFDVAWHRRMRRPHRADDTEEPSRAQHQSVQNLPTAYPPTLRSTRPYEGQ